MQAEAIDRRAGRRCRGSVLTSLELIRDSKMRALKRRIHTTRKSRLCMCGTVLIYEPACMRCIICGRRYSNMSASLSALWLQYRIDAQCSGLAAVEQAVIQGGPHSAGCRPGSPLIESLEVPQWFVDRLRKDRADWWEWSDDE